MQLTSKWIDGLNEGAYAPVRSSVCHLAGYTAEYRDEGDGPTLVIVPALAGGIQLLGPLIDQLSDHFRVLTYELRGERDCFALRSKFGMNELVDDLAEFLDRMCVERPILMGVSFGGAVAMNFAARNPGRLSSLVIQGADVRFKRTLLQIVARQVLSSYPLPPDNRFVNQFFNLCFGGRDRDERQFQFVTQQCWETDQSVIANRFRIAEKLELGTALGRIAAPTLLITGENDLFVSKSGLKEMRNSIDDCEDVRIRKAGHLAFVTHARQIAERVAQFTGSDATRHTGRYPW